MIGFPAWGFATLAVAASVWAIAQADTQYGWWLAILILLSITVIRVNFWPQANALISKILST